MRNEHKGGEFLVRAGSCEPAEGIDEADGSQFDPLLLGGLEHDESNKIVDDGESEDLFFDTVDGLTF